MKRLFIILSVVLILSNVAANAQEESSNFEEVTLTSADREKPAHKGKGPATRGITQPAYAHVNYNVVCIDFINSLPAVTINITNELTGKTVYAEIFNNSTSINVDLNGEDSGSYLINIESDGMLLYGRFELL